jgi:hypothetical protein
MMAISKKDDGRASHAEVEADSLEAAVRRQDAMRGVRRETLDLPCGKAERVRYKIGESTYRLDLDHYFLTDGAILYEAIFYSTGSQDPAPSREIMKTFRVTKLVGQR